MSKDGLTDHERAMGCTISDVGPIGTLATGTNGKIHNPDRFLDQDAEQFKTIFFQNGDYSNIGIVISAITFIGAVQNRPKMEDKGQFQFKIWHQFNVYQSGDTHKIATTLYYKIKDQAQRDRAEILGMIEAYHSKWRGV